MSSSTEKKTYEGRSITVTFEAARCRHAAECVRGLPEVFDTARRPWIRPDGAEAGRVAEVVRRCPSGALQYAWVDGVEETPGGPAPITRQAHGTSGGGTPDHLPGTGEKA
ncbi:(4Fe-4S)-binding protein [Streptomyces xiamenensis]|uniref:(4Fe-4S)-binding protein n=1 Tax=Streptomyces TaxID=1883 RepID=UPI001905863E|nr:(4Fe-4S)-binding protein [Streptomyces sp. G-5]QQN78092.1 (4Fe-4S)-binding protein [Streptomyces sp. XC 2026]